MTRPNPHIALIYHYDLARALAGEVVDWQAIPVQLAAYVDAVPYDTETDERGEW